jgi:hypothetical protein
MYQNYKSQLKKLVESGQVDQAKQFILKNREVFANGQQIEAKYRAIQKLEDAKKKIKQSQADETVKLEAINKLNLAILRLGGGR